MTPKCLIEKSESSSDALVSSKLNLQKGLETSFSRREDIAQ
jgi:hypothetical protein